jgi:acyl carrier protein
MTDRAAVVARIADKVQFVTGAEPSSLAHDKLLLGQAFIDSLDVQEIAFLIEEEFGVELDLDADFSIDIIADAVMAAKETAL